MAVLNSTILEKAWLSGTNDFQQRIPNPEIAGYSAAIQELFQPYNNDLFNQFSNMLVGLMGTYVESKLFENPLRSLKKPAAQWGNTERHVAVKYLQAHSYKVDDETLLKLEKPEFREWFYSVSAPRRYEFSWSKYEMQRVFSNGDSYAFDDLLQATITQTYSSDNYDEMNIMIQTFAEADNRLGGLFRCNLTAAPTDESTCKELLVKIRSTANKMKFPSVIYNHLDVPVHENGDSLVLWVTPETDAYIDVEALAGVFNLDKADIKYRKIVIPEFPMPNVYAALTSEDFIYCRDVQYGFEPPFYNPANMTYKYYLHHAQMIGCNPAANCVLFTTEDDTAIDTITIAPSALSVAFDDDTVEIGGKAKLAISLTGNGASGKIAVEPDAALITVSAADASGDAVALNSRTYVDSEGYLHVQKTNLAATDVITVSAKACYINPSGSTTAYTDSDTITVVAVAAQGAKECTVETNPYITYTGDTTEDTASE